MGIPLSRLMERCYSFLPMHPGGSGGHDIYFTQMDVNSGWIEPVNLGTMINTSGEELYPTVFNDTLYYSSDYLPGLGGT